MNDGDPRYPPYVPAAQAPQAFSLCHPDRSRVSASEIGFAMVLKTLREANARADRDRCPWCEIFTRSAAGMCTCTEACGSTTCPARDADDYQSPPVPVFPVAP